MIIEINKIGSLVIIIYNQTKMIYSRRKEKANFTEK